jgi:membrane protease YdiL (CAAX protease family)
MKQFFIVVKGWLIISRCQGMGVKVVTVNSFGRKVFNFFIFIAMTLCLYRAADVVDFFYLIFYYLNSGVNVNVGDFAMNSYKLYFIFLFSALVLISAALTVYFNCNFQVLNSRGTGSLKPKSGKFRLLVRLAGDCIFITVFVASFMLLYEDFFCHINKLCGAKHDLAMLVEAFFMLIAVVVVIAFLSKFRSENLKINLALHHVSLVFYSKMILVLAVFYLLFLFSFYILLENGYGVYLAVDNSHLKSSSIFFVLVVTALITPVMEEFIFRGYIQGKLYQVFLRPWLSVVVTSIFFALIHYRYPLFAFVQVFILSLLLGWARMKSGSIFPAVFMHITFNVVGVLASYYL